MVRKSPHDMSDGEVAKAFKICHQMSRRVFRNCTKDRVLSSPNLVVFTGPTVSYGTRKPGLQLASL